PAIWLATLPPRLQRKTLGRPVWLPLPSPTLKAGSQPPAVKILEYLGDTWFAVMEGAGLWRSTDDGQEWSPCPGLPGEIQAVRGSGASLYAATAEGCFVSLDAGQTWEERSSGLEAARHV